MPRGNQPVHEPATAMSRIVDTFAAARGFTLAELRERLELEPGEIAYVTGSLLDDVGDASSDLDVYVLTDTRGFERREPLYTNEERSQQAAQRFGMFYVHVGTAELDVECHLLAKLEELLAALDAYRPADYESVRSSYAFLGRFEHYEAVELLHRLRVAEPIAGAEELAALRRRLDGDKYLLWNVTYNMILAEAGRRGVERYLAGGDPENAYLTLCRRYDALADAYLFAHGGSLDRWKWRLHKLRAQGSSDFLARYREVHLAPARDGQLEQFVRLHLEGSNALADEIRTFVGHDRCIMRKI